MKTAGRVSKSASNALLLYGYPSLAGDQTGFMYENERKCMRSSGILAYWYSFTVQL